MGIPEKSEEYYLKALTLMEQMQSESDSVTDPELLKEDREQMASIYNNLYLSSVTNNERDKAKQYIQKTLHFQNLVYGENSIQSSNCQYIQSNCCLKLGQIDEAIECMNQAIKVFENPDEELKRAKDEMLLIKVRYFNQFASIYFIKGEYPKAKECIDQAYTICNDPNNIQEEPHPDRSPDHADSPEKLCVGLPGSQCVLIPLPIVLLVLISEPQTPASQSWKETTPRSSRTPKVSLFHP